MKGSASRKMPVIKACDLVTFCASCQRPLCIRFQYCAGEVRAAAAHLQAVLVAAGRRSMVVLIVYVLSAACMPPLVGLFVQGPENRGRCGSQASR
mmetsp:Transcript_6348/g.15762  ORF Transcript_6348/g.15762 Transcript_6348/m.15762 type:complete len:95 (-) Transcript_6348:192-476(-)